MLKEGKRAGKSAFDRNRWLVGCRCGTMLEERQGKARRDALVVHAQPCCPTDNPHFIQMWEWMCGTQSKCEIHRDVSWEGAGEQNSAWEASEVWPWCAWPQQGVEMVGGFFSQWFWVFFKPENASSPRLKNSVGTSWFRWSFFLENDQVAYLLHFLPSRRSRFSGVCLPSLSSDAMKCETC